MYQSQKQSDNKGKVTKHKSTIAPFECEHCGYIWFGGTFYHEETQKAILCSPCWHALYDYLDEECGALLRRGDGPSMAELQAHAKDWIPNKDKKPHLRPIGKRFHRNIPKWLRSAINADMVKTNGTLLYTVYSQDLIAIKVEVELASK